MRALLAFDKFKGALSARRACSVAAESLRSVRPGAEIDECPLTDGGEGFVEILTAAADGRTEVFHVRGPRGAPVEARIGLVSAGRLPPAARSRLKLPEPGASDAPLAIIEMASASGLSHLAPGERNPWQTSTYGTGELIAAAARLGCSTILLGIGGSATNDLGLGALAALGIEFFSTSGAELQPPIPASWQHLVRIHGAVASDLPPIRIACDVTNPLLGPRGCTAVFAPQKGLGASDVVVLEQACARVASMLCAHAGKPVSMADEPGAGAAGGIAFGLRVAARAELLPGFDLVSDWLELDRRLDAADVVLTGEGSFDRTSLHGKGPGAVLARAVAKHRTVHVFAGRIEAGLEVDARLHAISPADLPLAQAQTATADLLRTAIRRQFPVSNVP